METTTESNENTLKEFLQFLSKSAPVHVRAIAMQYVLGCTGTAEGQNFVGSNLAYLTSVIELMEDEQIIIAKDAYLSLVNLTTQSDIAFKLVNLPNLPQFVPYLIKCCLSESNVHVDIACTVVSNLSRWEQCSTLIASQVASDDINVYRIVEVLSKNPQKLRYLSIFLSNITRVQEIRKLILDQSRCIIQRLLPLVSSESLVVRGGVVGTLRNCCFETEYHEWLLSEAVDILPRLLLPLAGPEEFDEDEMEKLPDDLQYLGDDKKREEDPDIRQMLVETINKLCARKSCREYVKSKNAYIIIRELHKWEKDESVLVAVENLVSVLISDEPQTGMENLDLLEIPEDLEAKFKSVAD